MRQISLSLAHESRGVKKGVRYIFRRQKGVRYIFSGRRDAALSLLEEVSGTISDGATGLVVTYER